MDIAHKNKTDDSLRGFLTAAKSGVKKAAEAIDIMSNSNIRMDVISAGIAPTSRLAEISGSPEDIVVGVYISVEGDIPGHALLIFPINSALALVDLLMGKEIGTYTDMDEFEQSTIQEVGNIVNSAYLNSISDFYGCRLWPSPPAIAIDMASAVIDSVLLNTGLYDEDTISIVTRFAGNNRILRGFFLYVPEINTL
ncbi:MAG: chemotaxis protein CheC [Armatimonadota bacterium]